MFLCSHKFLELYSETMVKLVGNSLVLLDHLAFKVRRDQSSVWSRANYSLLLRQDPSEDSTLRPFWLVGSRRHPQPCRAPGPVPVSFVMSLSWLSGRSSLGSSEHYSAECWGGPLRGPLRVLCVPLCPALSPVLSLWTAAALASVTQLLQPLLQVPSPSRAISLNEYRLVTLFQVTSPELNALFNWWSVWQPEIQAY